MAAVVDRAFLNCVGVGRTGQQQQLALLVQWIPLGAEICDVLADFAIALRIHHDVDRPLHCSLVLGDCHHIDVA